MVNPLRKSDISGADPVIIQCPGCQTKFAVESSVLYGIEDPRFHCSRCDHVFSTNSGAGQPAPAGASAKEGVSAQESETVAGGSTSEVTPGLAEPMPSEDVSSPGLSQSGESSRNTLVTPEVATPSTGLLTGSATGSAIGLLRSSSWSMRNDRQSPGFQIPRTFDSPIAPSAPHEFNFGNSRTGGDTEASQLEMPLGGWDFGKNVERSAEKNAEKNDRAASAAKRDVPAVHGAANDEPLIVAPRWSLASKAASLLGPSSSVERNPRWLQESLASAMQSSESAERGRGFIWLVAPIVGFLGALGILAIAASSSESLGARLTEIFNPNASSVAPAGLELQSVQFKRVALDNGEVIPLISGKLVNGSDERMRHVVIDGLLFNRNGELVASARVNAASTLVRTRIKSLSAEVIRSFQTGQVVKRFDLKPTQAHEFSIALLPESVKRTSTDSRAIKEILASARFFSVRIVSAS